MAYYLANIHLFASIHYSFIIQVKVNGSAYERKKVEREAKCRAQKPSVGEKRERLYLRGIFPSSSLEHVERLIHIPVGLVDVEAIYRDSIMIFFSLFHPLCSHRCFGVFYEREYKFIHGLHENEKQIPEM